jgi:hypothetical protein
VLICDKLEGKLIKQLKNKFLFEIDSYQHLSWIEDYFLQLQVQNLKPSTTN